MTKALVKTLNLCLSKSMPWLISGMLVLLLSFGSILLKPNANKDSESLVVRKVEISLPPPPPPEPPLKMKTSSMMSTSPSVDVMGLASPVALAFSKEPTLTLDNVEKIERPKFDPASLDLRKALTLDFPTVEVKELDKIPHAISKVSIRYPRSLIKRGIKRVETQVVLIIDQQGKAYIKKIVDPVYPEMIEPIRHWVKNVKFTVPTKNGRPIQAIYPYTILFSYRV